MSGEAPPFELFEAARDLIAADSVSAHGNAAAVAVMRPLMERVGLTVELREAQALGVSHHNVLAAHPRNPGVDGGLLLVTHSDTVDGGDPELWTETGGDPFRMTEKDDRVYGLGVADVKIDALCKLTALWRTRELALRRPVHQVLTFAEEVGLLGARRLLEDGSPKHAFASAGEPSELRIVYAHKGYLVVKLVLRDREPPRCTGESKSLSFQGVTAHSSTPHLGDSAVEQVLDRVAAETDAEPPARMAGGLAAEVLRASKGRNASLEDVHAAFGGPVAAVEGGTVANRVPPHCSVTLGGEGPDVARVLALVTHLRALWVEGVSRLSPGEDTRFDPSSSVYNMGRLSLEPRDGIVVGEVLFDCRLLPGQDGADLAKRFGDMAAHVCRERGIALAVEVERDSPAMAAPMDGDLMQAAAAAARDVGTNPEPVTKATSTEAGVLASKGAESMVFGPGVSVGNVHRPNEYNLVPQILTAVDFYEALIRRLCG